LIADIDNDSSLETMVSETVQAKTQKEYY